MTNFKKYLLISLSLALISAVLLLVYFVPRFDHTDTAQYISTIKNISGDRGAELFQNRILKPMPIFISVLLSPVFGEKNSLIIQNLVFYFLSVFLIFLLIYRLYKNEKQAFYGTVLYIGAYPMLAYGLAALTDLSGWFFYILSILISLNFIEKPNLKTAFLAGSIAGLGILFKENMAAAPIFFASILFLTTNLSVKDKLKHILIYGIPFAIIILVNSIIIYKLYSYSYLDWYMAQFNHPQEGFFAYTPLRIAIEMIRVLLVGWVFVLLGIKKELIAKNKERMKVLAALILPSLSFFLWAYPHNRIAYIAAPLLVLLGSFGILRNYKNYKLNNFVELTLLSLYVLVNYAALEFFLNYGTILQPPGTFFG
ncbi:MAG: glycosyltransferase family 39 protein [Candidatus Nealsonbacteria bacterium]|nr:glycosyltransferase family 39 protein [Candidatus Nealsonbacteria bacterium]